MGLDPSKAITINTVQLWELRGSGTLSSTGGKMTGTRLFACAWEDRPDAIQALLGTAEWIEGVLVYRAPDKFPGFEHLKALDLSSEGMGALDKDTDESALYDYAKLTVTYRLPETPTEEEPGTDSFEVTETCTWRGEFLKIPGGSVVWGALAPNAGEPLLENQFVPIGLQELRYMRKNMAAVPKDAISAAQNHVNTNEFMGFDAGSVLFVGAESQKRVDAAGHVVYDVTFCFLARTVPWNHAWNAEAEAFILFQSTTGAHVLPDYDFELLKVASA